MKVGLFVGTHRIFTAEGGIGRYMRSLDSHMASRRLHGMTVERVEAPPSKYEMPNTILWSAFSNINSYDVLHVLGPLPLFQLLYKRHRNVIITTAHDFMPTSWIAANIKNPVERTFQKKIADLRISLNSDYLIAISSQTKQQAIDLGFDGKRIKVINYGIDENFFVPIKKKKESKTFRLGYIGTFPVRKNVKFAVSAFMLTKDKNMRFELSGRRDNEYHDLVRQSRSDKRIKFLGPFEERGMTDKDAPYVYDMFDAMVFPSVEEGFGLPIIEAQTRGLPVVMCKQSRVPKEVRKMCFEAEDEAHMAQIIQDLKDNGFNEKRRKATIAYARSFTWDKNIKETVNFYKEVS